MQGWIKLDRKIMNHWLWNEKPFDKARAWIDLLMMASYKDYQKLKGENLEQYNRGDVHVSLSYLSERWGWSIKKVRAYLRALEGANMIVKKGQAEGTTLTIVNYTFYQGEGQTEGTTEDTAEGTTKGQAEGTHNKNIKNIKKDNNSLFNARARERVNYGEQILQPIREAYGIPSDGDKVFDEKTGEWFPRKYYNRLQEMRKNINAVNERWANK